jgi:hypothetical protein
MQPTNSLVAVWFRQYIRTTDLRKDRRIHMTDERLTSLVNDAFKSGHKDGVTAGRGDLRQRLDAAGCRCTPVDRDQD